MLDRLHKILARAGVAALRPAEDMILQGRVTVNGRVVRELGARADPDMDVIAVDGNIIEVPAPTEAHRYLLLHKPTGVISTAHDTHDRPTVLQLVPNDARVFPVGRLDADSEGLMLLTDDGDLAYRLTHPRFGVEKEYRVLVDRTPELADLRRWRSGVEWEDGETTAPAWVEVLERTPEGTWLRVVMREGKKRQIREVARLLGFNVTRLIRVREGSLTLGDLPAGGWRELVQSEIEALRAHTQHVPSREADEERERRMSQDDTGQPRRMRVVRRAPRQSAFRSTPRSAEPRGSEDEGNAPPYRDQVRSNERGEGRTSFDRGGENRASFDQGNTDRGGDRRTSFDRDDDRRSSFDNRRDAGRDVRSDNRGGPPRGAGERGFDRAPRSDDRERGFGRSPRGDDRERGAGRAQRNDAPRGNRDFGGNRPRRDDARAGSFRRDERDFGRDDDSRGNTRSGSEREGRRGDLRGGLGGDRRSGSGGERRDSGRRGDIRGGLGGSDRRGGFGGERRGGGEGRDSGRRGDPRGGFGGGDQQRRSAPYRGGPGGPRRDDQPEVDGNRRDPREGRSFDERSRGGGGSFNERSRGGGGSFGGRSRGSQGGERSRGQGDEGRSFGDRSRRPTAPRDRPGGGRGYESRDARPRRDNDGGRDERQEGRSSGSRGNDRPQGRSFGSRGGAAGSGYGRSRSDEGGQGERRSGPPRGRSTGGRPAGPPRGRGTGSRTTGSPPARRPGFRNRRDDD